MRYSAADTKAYSPVPKNRFLAEYFLSRGPGLVTESEEASNGRHLRSSSECLLAAVKPFFPKAPIIAKRNSLRAFRNPGFKALSSSVVLTPTIRALLATVGPTTFFFFERAAVRRLEEPSELTIWLSSCSE